MSNYRITKYNPQFRDIDGSFTKNEWTSISDIGKNFDNKKLTVNEYFKVENSYIQAIIFIMKTLKQSSLYVTNLEKYELSIDQNIEYPPYMIETYHAIYEGKQANIDEIITIARLILRETLWCKLSNKNVFIHFGFDYYMYLGSISKISDKIIKDIEKLGLFVENFESPYNENIDN